MHVVLNFGKPYDKVILTGSPQREDQLDDRISQYATLLLWKGPKMGRCMHQSIVHLFTDPHAQIGDCFKLKESH